MTTETQILQELIEAVSRPDWWAIGITAVNAVIMAWLAWRQVELQRQQTKLQEQQMRQQEYELYRQLFDLVNSIYRQTRGFVFDIYWGIAFYCAMAHDNSYWIEQQQKISKIESELKRHSADIELKFPEEILTREKYFFLLSSMSTVVRSVSTMIKDGEINGSVQEELSVILSNHEKGDEVMIERIGAYLLNNDNGKELIRTITTLSDFGKQVCGSKLLEKIKEKI